jgi:RNA recognition motif-containing protein
MANNIYVGGFPYKTTKEDLAKLFSSCGTVTSAKIILDRETGRPKGFGFVEMSTDAEAKAAVAKLNGAIMGERKIFVVEGRPQEKRAGFSPKPSAPAQPPFVERRSGKDRRASPPKPGGEERRGAPPADKTAHPEKKYGGFVQNKWAKKPGSAPDKKKPWEKKPATPAPAKWVKRAPPVRGKKWFPKPD